MAFTRNTNCNGIITLKDGTNVNVDFQYNESAPSYINFNFYKDGVNVNGNYNVASNKLDNYSVSGGICETTILTEIESELKVVSDNYETV